MTKLILSGCNGRMGRAVAELCAAQPDMEIAAGIDLLGQSDREFPVLSSPAAFQGAADVLVDFSSPAALEPLLEFGRARRIPLVLCTTGYTQEQNEALQQTAAAVPIFRCANMSLGVNVLLDLVRRAAAVLGEEYDIEIVERHHNKKLDAPSGTALMLADAASQALPYTPEYVYDRQKARKRRDRQEIGISCVRGGGIVGEHEVIFAGTDEVIEFKHTAYSKAVFAKGAIEAAKFLAGKPAGFYGMSDVIG